MRLSAHETSGIKDYQIKSVCWTYHSFVIAKVIYISGAFYYAFPKTHNFIGFTHCVISIDLRHHRVEETKL